MNNHFNIYLLLVGFQTIPMEVELKRIMGLKKKALRAAESNKNVGHSSSLKD